MYFKVPKFMGLFQNSWTFIFGDSKIPKFGIQMLICELNCFQRSLTALAVYKCRSAAILDTLMNSADLSHRVLSGAGEGLVAIQH